MSLTIIPLDIIFLLVIAIIPIPLAAIFARTLHALRNDIGESLLLGEQRESEAAFHASFRVRVLGVGSRISYLAVYLLCARVTCLDYQRVIIRKSSSTELLLGIRTDAADLVGDLLEVGYRKAGIGIAITACCQS
jgi:hypothetical protein